MNYANIEKFDVSDGPGIRIALFTQGCSIRCPGCFNSELWNFKGGKEFIWSKDMENIIRLVEQPFVKGFSILGGEPLDNDLILLKRIIDRIKKIPNKTVWIYTGHVFEELTREQKEAIENADVLVDGPFIEELKDASLSWCGSKNQRLIDIQQTRLQDNLTLYKESSI